MCTFINVYTARVRPELPGRGSRLLLPVPGRAVKAGGRRLGRYRRVAQRASVLAIVDGLSAAQLTAAVLPPGWTPLGLIEHLGYAERHWFQRVATGSAAPLPWPEDPDDEEDEDKDAPFTTRRPAETVFAFYRDQIERSNAVLTSTAEPGWDPGEAPASVS